MTRATTPEADERMQPDMKHAIVLTILLLLASPASAKNGAVHIYEPVVIATSGHYVVTRAFSGTNPIQVAADDVDIDLNGFTITSTSGAVISIADGVTGVTIHGGHLTGGSDGIVHLATSVASRLRVEDVDIDATGYGIRVATLAARVTIAGCNLDDLSQEGVHLETTLQGSTFRVTNTRLTSIAKSGISVNGFQGGEISHCSVVGYGSGVTNGAGILTANTWLVLVLSNTVTSNETPLAGDDDGIVVYGGSRVSGNAVFSVGRDGIRADYLVTTIDQNLVDAVGRDGIRVVNNCSVVENSVRNAAGCAINMSGGSGVYRDNNVDAATICNASSSYAAGVNTN